MPCIHMLPAAKTPHRETSPPPPRTGVLCKGLVLAEVSPAVGPHAMHSSEGVCVLLSPFPRLDCLAKLREALEGLWQWAVHALANRTPIPCKVIKRLAAGQPHALPRLLSFETVLHLAALSALHCPLVAMTNHTCQKPPPSLLRTYTPSLSATPTSPGGFQTHLCLQSHLLADCTNATPPQLFHDPA